MGPRQGRLSDEEARVVEQYLPMVKYLAQHVASRLPHASVDLNDLIQAGVLGLIDAVKRYDPNRGIKFETYAHLRVKGAILDELRSLDTLPRTWRHRAKAYENAYLKLEQRLGRIPYLEEVAAEMGMPPEQCQEELRELAGLRVLSLDGQVFEGDKVGSLREVLADPQAADPVEALGLGELRERLAEAIEALPERHRLVITLYYYEELTMKEIAMVLGVTESRVSQIHAEAILSLRAKMGRFADGG